MYKKLINKILSLYVLIRYNSVPKSLRYFYRDTIYCKLTQIKYFISDYINKSKYKVIDFDGEFGQEVMFVLPHAYWHFKNGTLNKTISSKYTKDLYFFSENHEERYDLRTNEGNYNFDIPRILYSQDYDMAKWEPVPLKQNYRNSKYTFKKPILIIANRYNSEWGGPPISYYSIDLLNQIISTLKSKYTIIYNRPKPIDIVEDNSQTYELNDHEFIKKNHSEVIFLDDIYQNSKTDHSSFNELQFAVYANCERFISVHGGTASLASYFGGINLILSKEGPEHYFQCFKTLYPKLSGAEILHAKSDEEVKSFIDTHF